MRLGKKHPVSTRAQAAQPYSYYFYAHDGRLRVELPKKHRKKRFMLLSLLVIGLVVYVSANSFSGLFSSKIHALNKTPIPAVSAPAPIPQATIDQMTSQINAVIAANPDFQISVSIRDLNSEQAHDYGVSAPYLAASTSKLITASLFLHEVEGGRQSMDHVIGDDVSPEDTAQAALKELIVNSDDTAWQNFNDLLGRDSLQSYAQQIGLKDYDADTNLDTPDDIALLLQKLYKTQLINSVHTQLLLSYMRNSEDSEYIATAVPAGVKVYHKIGYLDDRVHDAAIIDNGKHPYVLVIFTKEEDYDTAAGQQIFHQITDATVNAFIK